MSETPRTSPILPGWHPGRPRCECDPIGWTFCYAGLGHVHGFLLSPGLKALQDALWDYRSNDDPDHRQMLSDAVALAVLLATAAGHPDAPEFAKEALKFRV
jgi:hypothetical protein